MLSVYEEAKLLAQSGSDILPVGTTTLTTNPYAQTFDRRFASSTVWAPTSAQLTLTGIWLPAGGVVSGITFVSGSTAESGGSHLWYALYKGDASLALLGQTGDSIAAAAFAANTALRLALGGPVTLPYSGLYYLGFCCVGTVPTLLNVTAQTAYITGGAAGMTPIVAATSTGSLTSAAPNPAGALTAITQCLYAFVD